MRELNIRWQRLVDATNQTCDRCGATGAAVERAVGMLTPPRGRFPVVHYRLRSVDAGE